MTVPIRRARLKSHKARHLGALALGLLLVGMTAWGLEGLRQRSAALAMTNPLDAMVLPYAKSYAHLKLKAAALTELMNCVGVSNSEGEALLACNRVYAERTEGLTRPTDTPSAIK